MVINQKGRWDLCANSAGDDMVAYSAGVNLALHTIIIMLGQSFEAKQRRCHSGLVHQLGAFVFAPRQTDQDLAVRFDKRCLISRLGADCLEPVPGTASIWSSAVHAHPVRVVCQHHPVLTIPSGTVCFQAVRNGPRLLNAAYNSIYFCGTGACSSKPY